MDAACRQAASPPSDAPTEPVHCPEPFLSEEQNRCATRPRGVPLCVSTHTTHTHTCALASQKISKECGGVEGLPQRPHTPAAARSVSTPLAAPSCLVHEPAPHVLQDQARSGSRRKQTQQRWSAWPLAQSWSVLPASTATGSEHSTHVSRSGGAYEPSSLSPPWPKPSRAVAALVPGAQHAAR